MADKIEYDNITFGVEVEFVAEVPFQPDEWPAADLDGEDLELSKEIALEAVRKTLKAEGISIALSRTEFIANNYTQFLVEHDETIHPIKVHSPPFQRFGVELISPKLTFTPQNLAKIWEALIAARRIGKLYTPNSAALHVHLGLDSGKPLPLEVAKRFAMLTTECESLIEEMLDKTVLADSYFNSFCKPLRENPHLENHNGVENQRLIRQIQSFKDLGDLLNPCLDPEQSKTNPGRRSWAYNYLGLDVNLPLMGKTMKPTIESRRHPSSVDGEEVLAWIKFNVGLLMWCCKSVDEDVQKLVDMTRGGVKYASGLQHFLRGIGLKDGVVQYYCLKWRSKAPKKQEAVH